MAFEEEFGIEVPDEAAEKLQVRQRRDRIRQEQRLSRGGAISMGRAPRRCPPLSLCKPFWRFPLQDRASWGQMGMYAPDDIQYAMEATRVSARTGPADRHVWFDPV